MSEGKGRYPPDGSSTATQTRSLGSLNALKPYPTTRGKEAKQTVRKLENRIKDLAEIIKYAEQYKANKSYNIAYKKAKNPDAYFRKHESQIILYGGARRMLEQAGISLKGLNIDKLKAEYQELTAQKKELAATYKNCDKELKTLNRGLWKESDIDYEAIRNWAEQGFPCGNGYAEPVRHVCLDFPRNLFGNSQPPL